MIRQIPCVPGVLVRRHARWFSWFLVDWLGIKGRAFRLELSFDFVEFVNVNQVV